MDWKAFLNRLVLQMLGSISENLLAGPQEVAVDCRTKARATANPWDDVLADMICGILGIPANEG